MRPTHAEIALKLAAVLDGTSRASAIRALVAEHGGMAMELVKLRARVEELENELADARKKADCGRVVGQPCLTSPPCLCCYSERLERERGWNGKSAKEWSLALQGLTPQGSEFANSPAACVEYVESEMKAAFEARKRVVMLERELAEERAESERLRGYMRPDQLEESTHVMDLLARLRDSEAKRQAAEHDIRAYRGALGYPVPGTHDGKLTSGETPMCGLCDAKERARQAAEAEQKTP